MFTKAEMKKLKVTGSKTIAEKDTPEYRRKELVKRIDDWIESKTKNTHQKKRKKLSAIQSGKLCVMIDYRGVPIKLSRDGEAFVSEDKSFGAEKKILNAIKSKIKAGKFDSQITRIWRSKSKGRSRQRTNI